MPLFGHKKKNAEREAAAQTDPNSGTVNTSGLHQTGGTGTGGYGHGIGQPGYGQGSAGAGLYEGHAGPMGHFQQPQQTALNQDGQGLAPTSHFNEGNQHSGGGTRMAGKVEHAVGSLVGSQALKAKGIQKEQEASAFKAQSAEIAEAERLEKEAMLRRERAVQHGAHPRNKALGGGQEPNFPGAYDGATGQQGYDGQY
ncbi:hypothetical protein NLI96_g3296 [Meripilus lineatus]|uniref:Uncharacterized protein n=1 Tax=Meripilus lineatus TaxID=2056292 RepID=A0AAD5VCG9_9APHY|nr:hypothetical protein NLI96_g3296 [Physisporinus lineatus]